MLYYYFKEYAVYVSFINEDIKVGWEGVLGLKIRNIYYLWGISCIY